MKRVVSWMLVCFLLISAVSIPVYASDEVIAGGLIDHGPVKWELTSDGTLTITGNRSVQPYEKYPWEPYAELITSVVVSDGITTIPHDAFARLKNLTKAYIGNTVTDIGENAFLGCSALQSITIPSSVIKINRYAFYNCSAMSTVVFAPDSQLETFADHAFSKSGVQEISIPASVKTIGPYAFANCEQLTTLNLTEGVQEIDVYAFQNCTALTGHLYLPESLTLLGLRAFEGVAGWTSVDINAAVSIQGLFKDNKKLQSVVFRGTLTRIPSDLFANCTSLSSVVITAPVETIENGAFSGCISLAAIELPQTLNEIGNYVFEKSGLTEIVIPDSVTELGMGSFSECKDLRVVTIGTGMDKISSYAFRDCSSLVELDLGQTRVINYGAFQNCVGLERVEIPASVEVFGSRAFDNCSSLKNLIFMGNAPAFDINKDSLKGVTAKAFYFPDKKGWTPDVLQDYGGKITWVAHTHSYRTKVTPPTCTEQGYTTYTCTGCGDVYVDGYVDALGHQWEDEQAVQKHCIRCGYTETGYRITIELADMDPVTSVWIDGKEYTATMEGNICSVILDHGDATNLVIYTYNDPNAEDVHTRYPVGMKVWILRFEEDAYTATYVPEFDNLLQYSGSSIRIAGVKGIRMITSIDSGTKKALTSQGLANYKLVEYGTALAWASDLEGGNALILGADYTKSNYAYKKGVADPVFKNTGAHVQYTNVLVGFTDDQCIPDIAMRPYIILEDTQGTQITIYGGMIYRSIGYIAYQNRNAFKPGSSSYTYVWGIIHHVYGDKYDAEYKG